MIIPPLVAEVWQWVWLTLCSVSWMENARQAPTRCTFASALNKFVISLGGLMLLLGLLTQHFTMFDFVRSRGGSFLWRLQVLSITFTDQHPFSLQVHVNLIFSPQFSRERTKGDKWRAHEKCQLQPTFTSHAPKGEEIRRVFVEEEKFWPTCDIHWHLWDANRRNSHPQCEFTLTPAPVLPIGVDTTHILSDTIYKLFHSKCHWVSTEELGHWGGCLPCMWHIHHHYCFPGMARNASWVQS